MTRILFTYSNGCVCETHFGPLTDYTTVSVLTCDVLQSNDCTIDEYVIDWYLDSIETPIQFTTGEGSDPDIVYSHPFTGNASIPVESGTWIPRIRYIIVDGEKMFPLYRPWEDYCELPTFDVEPFTCSNGGAGTYSHSLIYNNVLQNPEFSAQTVYFFLDVGQLWFACKFTGNDISDRFKVSYCTPTDPDGELLEDIVVGNNAGGYNFYSSPKLYQSYVYSFVINLETFTISSGDYLKIEIIPSYIQPPNLNTNWQIQMKCGSVGTAFVCEPFTTDMQTMDKATVAMVWNAVECRYELTWSNLEAVPADYINTDSYKYLNGNTWLSANLGTLTSATMGTFFAKNSRPIWYWVYNPGAGCLNMTGTLDLTYTNSTHQFVLQFSANADYQLYKTDIQNTLNDAEWTNYSSDPQNVNHYKYWLFTYREANSCGDAYTNHYWYCARASVFTFDDINYKITFDLAVQEENGYVNGECEIGIHEAIDTQWTLLTSTYNMANQSYHTHTKWWHPGAFIGGYLAKQVNNIYTTDNYIGFAHPDAVHEHVNDMCDWTAPWCNVVYYGVNAPFPMFFRYKTRAKIWPTDADPLDNFEIWNGLTDQGCSIPSVINYALIYKKLGGVILDDWDIGSIPYALGDKVIHDGKAWNSLQNNNNVEPVEGAWWTKISSA